MNCDLRPETQQASDHVHDLSARCKMPFNGITAVVHVNLEPNVTPILTELHASPELRNGLYQSILNGVITPQYWEQLELAMNGTPPPTLPNPPTPYPSPTPL